MYSYCKNNAIFNCDDVANSPVLGTYPVTYTATDACGNNSTCVIMVTVADEIPPQNICKSFLQVSLNFDGMAYVNNAIFNCDDVANSPVLVTLRAYDYFGNYNECDVQVTVIDLLPPTITCPAPITINCADDYLNINITGEPVVYDNCDIDTVYFSDQINLNACSVGEVIRTWIVRDIGGVEVQCEQMITLEDSTNLSIFFPNNYSTNSCNPDLSPTITGEPIISGDDCEFLYVGFNDDTTYQAFPACFVVYRHWEIYDWCNHDPETNEGYWESSQVLQVIDDIDPVIVVPNDTIIYSLEENCGSTFVNINLPTATDCSGQISFTNNSIYAVGNGGDASGEYPIGTHVITYYVEDNCGNNDSGNMTLTVVDAKNPTAVCKSGLIVNLDSNGEIEVAAEYINLNSFDNCSTAGNLTFQLFPNLFTCSDVGSNQVELIVTDEAGNSSSCFTSITIQNNPGDCPNAMISGMVNLWSGAAVIGVEMKLNGLSDLTNLQGQYVFDQLVPGQNYVLEAAKDGNDDDGISVLDIVLLSRSLVGLNPFNNPYQILAGDVDRDNGLSVFDLIQMQKLILKIDSIVPNSNSWQLIPDDFVFTNNMNPFLDFIPEYHTINNLEFGETQKGFVGIKLGDVSGNANPNLSILTNEDLLIAPHLIQFPEDEIIDELVEEHSTFNLKKSIETYGFQFSFQCEKQLEDVSIVFNQELPFNLDGYYDKLLGEIRIVGFYHEAQQLEAGVNLFHMNCRGKSLEIHKVSKSLMVDKFGNLLTIPVKLSNGI